MVKSCGTIAGRASRRAEASETLRVSSELLSFLLRHLPASARRRVAKGQAVYRQGEVASELFVVASGRISITMVRSDGQELLIDIVGKGALCGEGAAFDGLPRFSSAHALEESTLLVLSQCCLYDLMESHPELSRLIVQTTALKQRMLASRLSHVTQSSPEVRITELFSQISAPEQPIVNLTHEQIASLIGASRVTVTRAIQRLRRTGALRSARGQLEIVANLKGRVDRRSERAVRPKPAARSAAAGAAM